MRRGRLAACMLAVLTLTAGLSWAQDEAPRGGGPDFGTSSYEVLSLGAYAFMPERVNGVVVPLNDDGSGYQWMSGSVAFWTNFMLPAGAVIDYIGLDYCNTNPSAANAELYLEDRNADHGFTYVGKIPAAYRGSSCGYGFNGVPFNYQVSQNSGRNLMLGFFQGGTNDGSVKFAGAEVWFKRQVSPGPATATFADVPTTSPFFKYVEALVSAGIVAGCGGGNYCPGNPVTRGQMAVYLAMALGLHWPS